MMREKAVQLRRKYVRIHDTSEAYSHTFIVTCLTDVHISLYFSIKSCVDISSMNESIHDNASEFDLNLKISSNISGYVGFENCYGFL